ncbi:sugar ABC transporter ATP-binding protein [Alicyclobacillus mengziensis]|uniref:Sugar ABC transporter ATP-binding protein n=1 Tax=Alicyclobacillus mengziensis TaxID=2931921 RepID=A0A9X7VYT6_9BACL|nr:sugar ABC transporter ATP-binding protein [Alicyclobacillus mengziensis]QSO47317.1 sugar ABC transporter ATP-binding protein [Alicyclobacillus mengziensis]
MSEMRVSGLYKSYNANVVLKGINLTFSSGEIHALVGHNGAGKSTLLRMLAGVERPDTGEILMDDQSLKFFSPSDAYNHGIACVYQELRIIDHLTAADNMFLGQEPRHGLFLNRTAMWKAASTILNKYGLNIPPDIKVGRLSHAQKQLLEIISALQRDAKFLFLDEPTTSLEYHQIDLFLATIRRIADEQNVGIILVTHKLNEVYTVSDNIHVLCDGELVLSGRTSETPRADVIRYVVGNTNTAGVTETHDTLDLAMSDEVDTIQQTEDRQEKPILEVKNLTTKVVNDISVTVRPGQIIGIYGLVGAGRTEFLRALYGLDKVTAGEIRIDGKLFVPKDPRRAIAHGIAFLTEDRRVNGFVPQLDCIANAVLPVYARYSKAGFVRQRKLRRVVQEELQGLQVRGDIHRPMKFLSGGNQQKILFARASLQEPAILLLDEPTKGIDIGIKDEIYQIIRRWAETKRAGIIVVSTEEEEILKVSDDVMVFTGGSCRTGLIPTKNVSATDLRNLAVGEVLSS